jgi:hypothetical protein
MSTFGPSVAEVGSFAPGTISFTWVPDPEVVAQELIETANNLEDRSGPLLLSQGIAIQDMMERFKTKTDPDGEAWQQWAPSYAPVAERTNVGGLLERTQDMRDAATDTDAYEITPDSVFFSTASLPPYWEWIHSGTGGTSVTRVQVPITGPLGNIVGTETASLVEGGEGRGNALPPRPFVGVSFGAQMEILEVFDKWFDEAISMGVSSTGKPFARHSRRGPLGQFIPNP